MARGEALMERYSSVIGLRVVTVVVALVLASLVVGAEPPASDSSLKAKGLRKIGPYLALEEESKLIAMFRDIRKLQKRLQEANQQLELVEKEVERTENLIVQFTQQRRLLRQRLAVASSARESNQIAMAINELGDRITILSRGDDYSQRLREARGLAGQVREEYAQHVLETRRLYDQATARYEELAHDDEVKALVDTANQSSKRSVRLGPTLTFRRNGRMLEELEQTVFSESIDLNRGPGNLLYVTAYFNGKHAQEIAVDTGASIIALPQKVAEEAGIEVGTDTPTIQLRIADGGTVDAHRVTIGSVRVGKFTVEHVECAVLPEEFAKAPPLLGQSFLRHFIYKIDANNGKLVLIQVQNDPKSRSR